MPRRYQGKAVDDKESGDGPLYRIVDVDGSRRARHNVTGMTEHWFLAAMLVIVAVQGVISLYIGYRVWRKSERIEGLTAAVYLEARKILSQLQ